MVSRSHDNRALHVEPRPPQRAGAVAAQPPRSFRPLRPRRALAARPRAAVGAAREPQLVPVPSGRPAAAIPCRTVASFPPQRALRRRSGAAYFIPWLFRGLVPLNKHGVFVLDRPPPSTRGYQRDGVGTQKGHRSIVPFFPRPPSSVFVTASSREPG